MPEPRYWLDLTTVEIAALPSGTVAVLPVAAVEQHGPHLPVGTDAHINRGIVTEMLPLLDPALSVVILPEQTIGTSHEHLGYPGTLSFAPTDMPAIWTVALEGAARAGIGRVLLFNSHGGQTRMLQPTALMLRQRLGLMCFHCSWFDAGYPGISSEEIAFGIHGGDIETSMMLHLCPERVRLDQLADFPSAAIGLESAFELLQTDPGGGRLGGYGWMMQDLQPFGVAGNAAAASAEKGRALVAEAARRLAKLIGEIARFDASALTDTTFLGPRIDRAPNTEQRRIL